ncbi:MAG: ComF family protein [Candidatus Kapaibacteriota bacterium]|jgi:ComF family protein
MFTALYQAFLDVLAPRICLICGALLTDEPVPHCLGKYVCTRCFDRLPPADVSGALLAGISSHFRGDELAVSTITARFQREFDSGTSQESIHEDSTPISLLLYALKYHGMQGLGRSLGQELGYCLQILNQTSYDAIVPVPIHSARERERGYNQSLRIAEGIANIVNIPVEKDAVVRHTYTLSQTYLNAEERKNNVKNVFSAGRRGNALKGASILLVDDILTTGSTLNACAMTMLQYGARRVDAATVAKA